VFFTSDLHFWHSNIIGYCDRPYSDVEEMNEKMISNWNDIVGPNDDVVCLGDFSLSTRPVETTTQRLNGNKFLVPGNHDFCHSYHKKSRKQGVEKWVAFYELHGWKVLPEHYNMNIEGIDVNVCHLPYKGDVPHVENTIEKKHKDKYFSYRMEDDGKWLLCGHVHEKWRTKNKMINVGVDAWGMKPVHVDEIINIIKDEL